MSNSIIDAIVESDDFQSCLESKAEQAVREALPEALEEAMTEHDTILNLIARVEELEKKDQLDAVIEKLDTPTELKPMAHGILQVCEDKNYKMFLARQNPDWEVQHLFAVTYHLPGGSVTRYVIAESLAGAVGQGSCGLAANGIADLNRETAEKNATGIQLPLMLRGWSGYQF